jgi:hypothetical protein
VHGVTRGALFVAVLVASCVGVVLPAAAKPKPPVHCSNPSRTGLCVVQVGSPGRGGGPSGPGSGGSTEKCTDQSGQTVPCQRAVGTWDQALGCYVQVMKPQPAKSDPIWNGHKGGAVYLCTTWPPRATGVTEVWFATPPNAVDPRVLALRALAQLTLPTPSGHRSPSETQIYEGSPFTYVNLWTWFWTDPGTWRVRTATAHAGGVSATVTVTPTRLTFDPGDGSAPVTCQGPGSAWSSTDGNAAPTGAACGYQYEAATQSPLTSTQSITWAVSWRSNDGTNGTLPDLTTSKAGRLMVLQIESVVSR